MRIALSCMKGNLSLEFLTEKAGVGLEFVDEGPDGRLLGCKQEFETFERARPIIEEVREQLRGYLAGRLTIWIHDGTGWMSLADLTIKLERKLGARPLVDLMASHLKHVGP